MRAIDESNSHDDDKQNGRVICVFSNMPTQRGRTVVTKVTVLQMVNKNSALGDFGSKQ